MKLARFIPAVALSLFCLLAAAAQPHRGTHWTIVNLGVPSGAEGSRALGVNNRGDVVGDGSARSGCCTYSNRPFLWQHGIAIDLMPPGQPPNPSIAQAVDISDRGTAIVQMDMGRIFMWRDGVATQLPFAGVAKDINRHDAVVGSVQAGFSSHAFIFQNGVLYDLGTLGGIRSDAFGVNNLGTVVGQSRTTDSGDHAFVFENGVMRDIGTFGGEASIALDVNDRGTVVGVAEEPSRQAFAFIWDAAGGMRKLLDMPSSAVAINNRGDIVGTIGISGSFLISDGVLTRLESLPEVKAAGFTAIQPEDINERGWIAGTGTLASGGARAVLLIPGRRHER
jgi:probable HAF family extracellular repeat protein